MTTPMDVQEAIASVIAGLWPERMIYRDFCPADFQRPSSYLWLTQVGSRDLNISQVERTAELTLELFCEADQYDESSTEALRQDQQKVLLDFGGPKLKVGDRYISVKAIGAGQAPGSAFVEFVATWADMRPGLPGEEQPMMEHYKLRQVAEERKENT